MRRADYWLVFAELCERYPLGVELSTTAMFGGWWECRVRTHDGIRTGQAADVEGAVEVVATSLGVTVEAARAARARQAGPA